MMKLSNLDLLVGKLENFSQIMINLLIGKLLIFLWRVMRELLEFNQFSEILFLI